MRRGEQAIQPQNTQNTQNTQMAVCRSFADVRPDGAGLL